MKQIFPSAYINLIKRLLYSSLSIHDSLLSYANFRKKFHNHKRNNEFSLYYL